MPASPREEELGRGERGQEAPTTPPNGGASAPGLVVYVVTHSYFGGDMSEVLGVASTPEEARRICDEDWAEGRADRTLRWDDRGAYCFRNNRRVDVGYEIDAFTVR